MRREEYREWKCRVHGVPWRYDSPEWQQALKDGWMIRAVYGDFVLLARPVAQTAPETKGKQQRSMRIRCHLLLERVFRQGSAVLRFWS